MQFDKEVSRRRWHKKTPPGMMRASITMTLIAQDTEHLDWLVTHTKLPKGFEIDKSKPHESKYKSGSYAVTLFCFYKKPE